MALSFIGITSAAGEADGSWTIALPGSVAAGDLAVIVYANDSSVTASLSGDSDEISISSPLTSVTIRAWNKTLTSGEISDGFVTLTDSGGNGLSGGTVLGVWRDAAYATLGTVSLQTSNTTTHSVSNVGLTSGAHYFALAFLDDDLATVSGYPTDYASSQGSLQCGSDGAGGTLAWARSESLPTNTNEFTFSSSDTGVSFPLQIDEGATYNETITETITAADSYAPAATINAALTETVTATDLYGQVYNETLTETLTASDAFLGGTDYYQTISESIAATDNYGATVTEPGGWTIPAPPTDGWIEKGSGGGAWTEISDTDTDWTEI